LTEVIIEVKVLPATTCSFPAQVVAGTGAEFEILFSMVILL